MAEAQTPTPAAEPSMEEILASIRKIIADEHEPAPAANGEAGGDVIELTQMVQDDGSVVDLKSAPPAEETPPMTAAVEPPPEPTPAPPPPPPPEVKAAPYAPPPPPVPAGVSLISDPAVSVAASSLSTLASTVEIERLASSPMTSTFIGNGTRTLEDMTMELMRPLLKQWLDQNLPSLVDRLVQKEIERISKRAKD